MELSREVVDATPTLASGDVAPHTESAQYTETARLTQRDLLVQCVAAAVLWHDSEGTGYATVPLKGHYEHYKIRSKGFRSWILRQFYSTFGSSPGGQAQEDAIRQIEAVAQFDGPEEKPSIRLAELSGKIYLDLCDEQWRAIEIDQDGWRVLDAPPVKFIRRKGMLPLPEPQPGDVADLNGLRSLLNVPDDTSWRLLLAAIVSMFRPSGPFPVVVIIAEQGSGKSVLCRVVRSLIDPSVAPLRSTPREERDLLIAATNGWLVVLDNLSGISRDLSDSICRLSTGGGNSFRELYTDGEEVLFSCQRPVLVNGIDDLATRGDLLDRAIVINLPAIPEDRRRTEAEINARLDSIRPAVLGALLSAVSRALKELPNVRLDRLPRMADFAAWATASEESLGLAPGQFMEAYMGNRRDAVEIGLEASPLAQVIQGLDLPFEGTPNQLLGAISERATEEARRARTIPATTKALSDQLRRLAPALRQIGINIHRRKERARRVILIERTAQDPSQPSHPSQMQLGLGFEDDGSSDR